VAVEVEQIQEISLPTLAAVLAAVQEQGLLLLINSEQVQQVKATTAVKAILVHLIMLAAVAVQVAQGETL
jgi:type III secretory pathway component EscT